MEVFGVYENNTPCSARFNSLDEGLGWDNHLFTTYWKAAVYLDKYLGAFSPGKEFFLSSSSIALEGSTFRIVRMEVQ